IQVVLSVLDYPFIQEKKQIVAYSFAKNHSLLPLSEDDSGMLVAFAHPLDLETIEEARCLTGKEIKEILCPKSALEEAIESCYHRKENEASEIIASLRQGMAAPVKEEETEGYDLLEQKSDSPVIRMLNVMLLEAIQQGASDVHFEPLENGIGVRY